MFEQSIFVYLTLISIMVIFGMLATLKGNVYTISKEGEINTKKSFWSFEIIFPLLLFAIIMGIRYDVGVDYFTYLYNYLHKNYTGKEEYLFFFLSDVGWYFNFHYTIYFGVIAFLQVLFFFLAFKDERYLFPFLVFFLFANGGYSFWMNVIRQALAMCIWLYSLRYIEHKKFYKYLIFGLIAFLIHRSSIILLIFYPILRNGKDYFKSIPLQLVLVVFAFIIKDLFYSIIMQLETIINFYSSLLGEGLYDNYGLENMLDSVIDNEGTGIAYFFKILLNVMVILYSHKLKKFYNNKKFVIVYFFFFIGIIATYIFPLGAYSITRPFRYFFIFQTIMYAYLLYYFFKERKHLNNLIMFWILLITFLGIFILSQYNADPYSHSLYQFYFQHNIHGYPN